MIGTAAKKEIPLSPFSFKTTEAIDSSKINRKYDRLPFDVQGIMKLNNGSPPMPVTIMGISVNGSGLLLKTSKNGKQGITKNQKNTISTKIPQSKVPELLKHIENFSLKIFLNPQTPTKTIKVKPVRVDIDFLKETIIIGTVHTNISSEDKLNIQRFILKSKQETLEQFRVPKQTVQLMM